MIGTDSIERLNGATVYGADGDKIGSVGQVYVDQTDGHPSWVTVRTGLFGTSESFIPLDEASIDGDAIRVTYDKARVKDAPRIDTDGELSTAEEDELYRYYGLTSGETGTHSGTTTMGTTGYTETSGTAGFTGAGHDTSGPNTDSAMTRSEEQLHVGTERVETGRARLRKYVTTEQQTVTVPVTREEVRLEREPITDANVGAAYDGPAISEEEHEVILTEERPVVQKEAVPVERVRLDTETVTENRQVTEDVRKEEIELDDDANRLDDDRRTGI
ncbi:MAG: photosystem reaction center subunit [Naasia sp.]|nr:photosystem reaction center subunit [Naasia sp.]